MAHRCADLDFEIGLVAYCHAANSVGLEVFPDQFVWIAVGRIGRQKKQPQSAVLAVDKSSGLLGNVGGAAIDDQKIARLAPAIRRLRNSMKTAAFTPPFSLIMNRIWPRAVIAEIRLMRRRRPVVSTMGVAPSYPTCARHDDRSACGGVAKEDLAFSRCARALIFG